MTKSNVVGTVNADFSVSALMFNTYGITLSVWNETFEQLKMAQETCTKP